MQTSRAHRMAVDVVLGLAAATAGLVSAKTVYDSYQHSEPMFSGPSAAAIVVSMLAVTLPLILRRRFPLSVLVAVVAAFLIGRVAFEVAETSITAFSISIALYSAAVHGCAARRVPVLAASLGAVGVQLVRELFIDVPDQMLLGHGFEFAYNIAVLSLPWLLGATIRTLRAREVDLAARAVELQAERDENAAKAVFAERVRIARELHDVVAHHVSVMGVQAGAARMVMSAQPDKAMTALSTIESSSRQAVSEMHHLLGFLRRDEDGDSSGPQPGLAQIDDLIAGASDDAMQVTLDVDGDLTTVPATLQLSAYRIVQEALTNTRKHSDATAAAVHLRHAAGRLSVRIVDNGSAVVEPSVGGGHGLIGMRERVGMHHGALAVGTTVSGGFSVDATFPVRSAG